MRYLALLLMLATVPSCTFSQRHMLVDAVFSPRAEDADVPIFIGATDIKRPFLRIAHVDIYGYHVQSKQARRNKAKRMARRMGADALLTMKESYGSYWAGVRPHHLYVALRWVR